MVRDVLGSLLLLGGALWLWLGLVQAQRRQLRLLEELAASLEQMASAIRFRRETLLRLLAAQRQRPLAGPYYGAVLAALTELRRGLEQESRQREKLWFAGLFSGAGLLLILLI